MKILMFTEGTIIMPNFSPETTRDERVRQSLNQAPFIHDFKSYVPNGNPTIKILAWKQQGAKIFYLTSRTTPSEIEDIRNVLNKYNFPDCQNLYYRQEGEAYKDVAQKLLPDVLIEDDCESIGGEVEMTFPHIKAELQHKIKPIIVKEFGGIDHLPDNLSLVLPKDFLASSRF